MVTLRITADVPDDRRLTLTLPEDVPTGPAEVVVTVDSIAEERERIRAESLKRFLARARSVDFQFHGSYPSRDELHERD
jgi:hypothetical protein